MTDQEVEYPDHDPQWVAECECGYRAEVLQKSTAKGHARIHRVGDHNDCDLKPEVRELD